MIKREELVKEIQDYFSKIYFESDKITALAKKLRKKYNVDPGEVPTFVTNSDAIAEVADYILYQYADCIFSAGWDKKYFSPIEIKDYSKSGNINSKSNYPIEFENVIQVNDDQFITTISASKLFELYNKQIIIYNALTQRAPKVYMRDGKETYKIYVNESSVNSIKSLLLRELFIPNDLTLNIRPEDMDNIFYDRANATITIKDGTLDILDGYHRYQAIIRTILENPQFDINFILNITIFDQDKAQRFIAQQDKKNKIRSSYAKSLDNSRYETIIVKKLNEDSDSQLFHKFTAMPSQDTLDIGKAIDVVGKAFKIQSSKECNYIEKYLCKELNNYLDAGGEELIKRFDDLSFRYAIICLGLAFNQGNSLRYKIAIKKEEGILKSRKGKREWTVANLTKVIKESEII